MLIGAPDKHTCTGTHPMDASVEFRTTYYISANTKNAPISKIDNKMSNFHLKKHAVGASISLTHTAK